MISKLRDVTLTLLWKGRRLSGFSAIWEWTTKNCQVKFQINRSICSKSIKDWTSCGCEPWWISEKNILVTRKLYHEVWTHYQVPQIQPHISLQYGWKKGCSNISNRSFTLKEKSLSCHKPSDKRMGLNLETYDPEELLGTCTELSNQYLVEMRGLNASEKK